MAPAQAAGATAAAAGPAAPKPSKAEKKMEKKLATLTAINGMLKQENEALRGELAQAQAPRSQTEQDIQELTAEFQSRLAEAEDKAIELAQETDTLRAQLRLAKGGAGTTEARLQEKNELVATLRAEGEALARRQGELEAACKKLRAQNRALEEDAARLTGQLDAAAAEAQLGRQLQESGAQEALEQLQDLRADRDRAQRALAEAAAAAQERVRSAVHASEAALRREFQDRLAAKEARVEELLSQLEAAHATAQQEAGSAGEQEEVLRRELRRAEERARRLEADRAALQLEASEATAPLMREKEALQIALDDAGTQASLAKKRLTAEAKALRADLAAARDAAQAAEANAQDLKAQISAAEAAGAKSRAEATAAAEAGAAARRAAEAETAQRAATAAELDQVRGALKAEKAERAAEAAEHQGRLRGLEQQLAVALREKQEAVELLEREVRAPPSSSNPAEDPTAGSSPSAGIEPVGSSAESSLLEGGMEELLGGAAPATPTTHGKRAKAKSDLAIELLQAEVAGLRRERAAFNAELQAALEQGHQWEAGARQASGLQAEMQDLSGKLTVAMVLLGERNERIEELEEDVREVKGLFKNQVVVMVDQINEAKGEAAGLRAQLEASRG